GPGLQPVVVPAVSVVTTHAPHGLRPGEAITFGPLAQAPHSPAQLQGGQTYYVAQVLSPTSFTFQAFPTGGPVRNVAVDDTFIFTEVAGAAPVSILTEPTNGFASFYFDNSNSNQWVRITVYQKQPGFSPDPGSSELYPKYPGLDGSLTQYVQLGRDDKT